MSEDSAKQFLQNLRGDIQNQVNAIHAVEHRLALLEQRLEQLEEKLLGAPDPNEATSTDPLADLQARLERIDRNLAKLGRETAIDVETPSDMES